MAEPRVEPEPFDQTEFRRDVRPNSERTDLPGCTLVGSNQAAATEDSFVSVISMNPATIRICSMIILGLRIVRPSVTVSPNLRASSLETERKTGLAISILATYY